MGVGGQCHAPAALPPGKTWYRRLGRPQDWSGWVRKISPPPGFDPQTVPPPPGFDPQTVQPVASRWQFSYTLSNTLCHFKPQEIVKNILTQDLISSCNLLVSRHQMPHFFPSGLYWGADKSLTRPGRKQFQKHVRDTHNFNNVETRAVIGFFFPARQGAQGNSSHSDRNISLFPSWSG